MYLYQQFIITPRVFKDQCAAFKQNNLGEVERRIHLCVLNDKLMNQQNH